MTSVHDFFEKLCAQGIVIYQLLTYLLHCCTLLDKHCISHDMSLYQVMVKLHFLNDVANDG